MRRRRPPEQYRDERPFLQLPAPPPPAPKTKPPEEKPPGGTVIVIDLWGE